MVEDVKNYLDQCVENGSARVDHQSPLTVYTITNAHSPSMTGRVYLTDTSEIAYCTFAGLSNRKFARGESLDIKDIKHFIEAAQNNTPTFRKSLFGTKIVLLPSNITLRQKLD